MREGKEDESVYRVKYLYSDQKKIVAEVMSKLKEFIESDNLSSFKPLRMTVMGAGGSGKSVVINTLVTLMRNMFQYDGVVRVAAPTGTAAFNVGGETFHHLTNSKPTRMQYKPGSMNTNRTKRAKLIQKFQTLLAIIIDERSLATSRDLGTTNRLIAETIYGGGPFSDESWGGLPIVIMFGDDHQLPGMGEGAFKALISKNIGQMVKLGRESFIECAQFVMSLKGSKRIQDGKQFDKDLISAVRTQEDLSEAQVAHLLNLDLKSYEKKFGKEARQNIEDKSIFLFFTNAKRIRHNLSKLAEYSSANNPVAIIKAKGFGNTRAKADSRHFDSRAPPSSLLCVGAKVALDNKNYCPLWGLHNGACGTVKEIIFEKGTNPNHGDLPLYVVVHFPLYCGPVWDMDDPKAVPIPIAEYNCRYSSPDKTCCTRTFLPLCLAYARTIHKFQGMSAGPVDEGKITNMFESIVCDPHTRDSERSALGLFYTALSRATTLGDNEGKGSAIYFIGEAYNESRIRNIGKKKHTNDDYERLKQRTLWVDYLNQHLTVTTMSKEERTDVLEWAESFQMSHARLYDHIQVYIQQKTNPNKRQRTGYTDNTRTKQSKL